MSDIINILLVEDNFGDIRLTKEAFKECSIVVNLTVVTDGEKAINHLIDLKNSFAEKPNLILLDLNLPKKSGKEVLEFIKNDAILKIIPVIVLTTSSSEKDVNDSYLRHANSYINKPVDFDKFFDVIEKIEEFWLSTAILSTMIR